MNNGGIQLILITAGTDPSERDDGRKLRRGAISNNVRRMSSVGSASVACGLQYLTDD